MSGERELWVSPDVFAAIVRDAKPRRQEFRLPKGLPSTSPWVLNEFAGCVLRVDRHLPAVSIVDGTEIARSCALARLNCYRETEASP